jgi:hypothetical protein
MVSFSVHFCRFTLHYDWFKRVMMHETRTFDHVIATSPNASELGHHVFLTRIALLWGLSALASFCQLSRSVSCLHHDQLLARRQWPGVAIQRPGPDVQLSPDRSQ